MQVIEKWSNFTKFVICWSSRLAEKRIVSKVEVSTYFSKPISADTLGYRWVVVQVIISPIIIYRRFREVKT